AAAALAATSAAGNSQLACDLGGSKVTMAIAVISLAAKFLLRNGAVGGGTARSGLGPRVSASAPIGMAMDGGDGKQCRRGAAAAMCWRSQSCAAGGRRFLRKPAGRNARPWGRRAAAWGRGGGRNRRRRGRAPDAGTPPPAGPSARSRG